MVYEFVCATHLQVDDLVMVAKSAALRAVYNIIFLLRPIMLLRGGKRSDMAVGA